VSNLVAAAVLHPITPKERITPNNPFKLKIIEITNSKIRKRERKTERSKEKVNLQGQ
jgi:hypothetical protein